MTYSLPQAYAVFCGRVIITVNLDNLYAPKQGKLASVCLQRFSSIFETKIHVKSQVIRLCIMNLDVFVCKIPLKIDKILIL